MMQQTGHDAAVTPSVVLAIHHLAKAFGSVQVLEDIDLELNGGEIVALMGENGAGKSTLLNIVSGSFPADSGEMVFIGSPSFWSGPKAALDAGIAVVHQELSVIRALTVAENMFLGDYCCRNGIVDRKEMHRRATALLAEIDASHIRPDAPMDSLRVADQQAVEIAKALRRDLKLLLLDEPTSSLTPHEVRGLFTLLRRLRDRGVAIVFISHRIEEALDLCDRIVVLRDGRLISNTPSAETDRGRIVADMAGRQVPTGASRPEGGTDEVVVRAMDLGDGGLVRDVSFDLHQGEILGLFGLVGAGRTEVLEMIYGLRPIVEGSIERDGVAYQPKSPQASIRDGVALLPEGRKFNGILPFRPIRENVSVSALPRLGRFGILDVAAETDVMARAASEFGIVMHNAEQPISTLSGGNQQKCILARCLSVGPRILLLDEPTHGVDVRTKEQVYEIIRRLADDGMSIIVASSDMLELFQIASRILVLSNGRVGGFHKVAETTPVDLMRDAFRHLN